MADKATNQARKQKTPMHLEKPTEPQTDRQEATAQKKQAGDTRKIKKAKSER
jgi:hypothetical protein